MGFIKRFTTVFGNLAIIADKRHFSFWQRLSLMRLYLSIAVRRFVFRSPGFFDRKEKNILGFKLTLDNFRTTFYWIFMEIFIHEIYYFKSDVEDPLIIDCGGNIGISVLYFKLVYPKARIITFEPSPDNVLLLKKNLAQNGLSDVQVVEAAVGGAKGEISFYTQGPGTTMYEEFAHKQKQLKLETFGEKVKAPIFLLSDYISGPVKFLKMDVEGAEGEILEELDRTGAIKFVEQIGMEYHQFSFEKNRLSDLARVLEKNKYEFFCASESHNIAEPTKTRYKTFMIYAKRIP